MTNNEILSIIHNKVRIINTADVVTFKGHT